jgi:hypothetical protein
VQQGRKGKKCVKGCRIKDAIKWTKKSVPISIGLLKLNNLVLLPEEAMRHLKKNSFFSILCFDMSHFQLW